MRLTNPVHPLSRPRRVYYRKDTLPINIHIQEKGHINCDSSNSHTRNRPSRDKECYRFRELMSHLSISKVNLTGTNTRGLWTLNKQT